MCQNIYRNRIIVLQIKLFVNREQTSHFTMTCLQQLKMQEIQSQSNYLIRDVCILHTHQQSITGLIDSTDQNHEIIPQIYLSKD